MLGNLIDNAVKYSPAGSPVQVSVTGLNGNVAVSVRDEGSGIASGDQRLIFEKFGRVTGGNTKPGTGLGLYIARSIAEAHGGSLAVASAQGRGADVHADAADGLERRYAVSTATSRPGPSFSTTIASPTSPTRRSISSIR